MRLTVLLVTSVFLSVHATGVAQSVTISGRDIPLKEIFTAIKKQTGYVVFGNAEILGSDKKLTLSVYDLPLKDFLDVMLRDQPFTYQINSRTITLVRKTPEVLSPLEQPAVAAGMPLLVNVRGFIQDSTGLALIGASVRVKGTSKGVVTNQYGEFNINADIGDKLVISFVGYQGKEVMVTEIPVGGMHIILQRSNSKLDEVQVQAYGKTSRRISTGTIYTIKGDVIAKQNVTNPLMALQGRIPNMVITPFSGQPGAALDLQIRGQNSIGSLANGAKLKTRPLVLVDGVPFAVNIQGPMFNGEEFISALRNINPMDIEQIDVLTDAASTSIYGSRGGNGVILITTKKGKPGMTTISASLSGGAQTVTRRLDLLNTKQYLEMRREAYRNYDMEVPDHNSAIKNYQNFDLTVWDTTRDVDWQKEFFKRSPTQYGASASISGGNEQIQYLLGLDHSGVGYAENRDFKNDLTSVNLNISGGTSDQKLKVSLTGSYSVNNIHAAAADFMRNAILLPPNAPEPFLPNGQLNWEPNLSSPSREATWQNPYANLLYINDSRANTLRSSINISYELLSNLQLMITGGLSDVTMMSLGVGPIVAKDPATNPRGDSRRKTVIERGWTLDPQLNYSTNISEGQLKVTLGATASQTRSLSEYLGAGGYTSDALIRNLGFATTFFTGNESQEYNYAGVFGRINYDWNDKYILDASARRDGSSRFGPGNRFGNFWAFSGAWIFTNEEFLKNSTGAFSFGKIRASYGSSGNDGIGDYGYMEMYETPFGSTATYQGLRPLNSRGVINNDYHWEDIRRLDVGIDLGFFKDKVLLAVTRWITRADDQLGGYRLSATAGADNVTMNQDAKIQGMGWDFMVNLNDMLKGKLKWTSILNFGLRTNKVLHLPESGGFGVDMLVKEGEKYSEFAAVRTYMGVNPVTGLYQFLAADGTVSSYNSFYGYNKRIDRVPYTIGMENSFSYKGVSLSFFLQFTRQTGKNYIYDPAFNPPGVYGGGNGNQPVELMNRWQKPGDVALYQKFSSGYNTPSAATMEIVRASDQYFVDASFITLRTMSISYSLPVSVTRKLGVKGLSLSAQGQNLLLITGYKGLDPETQNVTSIPQMRGIRGSISLTI